YPLCFWGWPVGPNQAAFSHPSETIMITDSGLWIGTPACNATSIAGIESGCDSRNGGGYAYRGSYVNPLGGKYVFPYVYKPTTNLYSAPLPLHHNMAKVASVDGHCKAMRIQAMISPVDLFAR